MHPLHDHLAAILVPHLKNPGPVVWYDSRKEFLPFVTELAGGPPVPEQLLPITVSGMAAHLLVFGGSYFALKQLAEPLVSGEKGEALLLYLPGATWNPKGSLLMELEATGRWDPQLRREARRCLQKAGYGEGSIDEILKPDTIGYADLVTVLSQQGGTSQLNLLRTVINQETDEAVLAAWLADPSLDGPIQDKGAVTELEKLVTLRLGGPFTQEGLAKARAKVIEFVLLQEFLADWKGEPIPSLNVDGKSPKKEDLERIRKVTRQLRSVHPKEYPGLADGVEKGLGLAELSLNPEHLGVTDTFRFEEKTLFNHGANLVVDGRYGEALALAEQRQSSFWVDAARTGQWEVCRRCAVLGLVLEQAEARMGELKTEPRAWVAWYVGGSEAAAEVDRAYRELETCVAGLEDDPEAVKAYGVIRHHYEGFVHKATAGFTQALQKSSWQVEGSLQQTAVFEQVVKPLKGKTAFLLIDAMRYEMGLSLAARMASRVEELRLQAVVAALPTITPVGMAALMPEAARGFDVVFEQNKLGAVVGGHFLSDLAARKKHLKERVPTSEDLDLGTVLDATVEKLKALIEKASLVVVRSQEMDSAGESGFTQVARRVMDGLLTTDLMKAVQKLQRAGVTQFVLCADHGHQFAKAKADDMKLETPAGLRLEDHRRCLIGQGLQVVPGTVKAFAKELGYRSDLEFLFPAGAGIFKVGGDLAFHHGGVSLQELIVPLLTFRAKVLTEVPSETTAVQLVEVPTAITNRIFAITLELKTSLYETNLAVHPVLVLGEQIVGEGISATGALMDGETRIVTLESGKPAKVYFQVRENLEGSPQLQILDPLTDRVLAKSKPIPVSLLA